MTDLLIRNIEPHLKRQLEERAHKHKRSLTEEAKALLRLALAAPEDNRKLGTLMYNLVRPEDRSDDYVFEIRGEVSKPPEFE